MARFDIQLNTTMEIDDENLARVIDEYRENLEVHPDEQVSGEDALEWIIEADPPQDIALDLLAVKWWALSGDVTYLDG